MTSLSVTEIAHRTGFVDDRHLSWHFIRAYGLTPGRFLQVGRVALRLAQRLRG